METYREPIADYISKATGLQVKIGSLDVDFSQGLGLKAGGLTVRTGDGKRGLFAAESLFLQAKLAPLLQGKFEVKKTSIIKPVVSLYLEEPADMQGREKPLTKKQFNLATIRKSLRDIRLTVDIIEIKDAQIYLVSPGFQQHQMDPAILSLNLKLQRPKPDLINLLVEDLELAVGNIRMTGNVSALDILAKTGVVEADFQFDPFTASDFKRLLRLLPATARQTIDKRTFSGKVRKLSLRAKAPLESLQDIGALIKRAELNMTLGVDDFSLKTEGLSLALQSLDIEQAWLNGRLDHKIETVYMGGKILLEGSLLIKEEGESFSPVIDSSLQLVDIDIAGLQLKKDWLPRGGKISATFKVKGPVQNAEQIRLDGTFSVRDLELNPPRDKPNMRVAFAKIDGVARLENGAIEHDIHGVAFGADFSLKGVVELNKVGGEIVPEIDSDFMMAKLDPAQIKPLVASRFFPDRGSLAASFHLSGPLTSFEKIRWQGTIDGEQIAIDVPDGLPEASFPSIKFQGDWADNRLRYEITGKALGGDFSTAGSFSLAQKNGETSPAINAKFSIKNIDLKPLKPIAPFQWFPAEGMFSSQFNLNGSLANLEKLRWDGKIQVDRMLLIPGGGAGAAKIPVPRIVIKGIWADRKLKHDVQANIFGGTVRIKGDLSLGTGAGGKSPAGIQSHIKLTGLNFSKAKLPWEWAPDAGSLSGSLTISATEGEDQAVLLNGTLTGEKLMYTPQDQRHSVGRIDIAVKSESSDLTTITMNMQGARFNQLDIKLIRAVIKQTPDTIHLTNATIHPAHGKILIKGEYKIQAKAYRFDLQGRKLRMEDFAKEDVVSPLTFNGTFRGAIPQKGPAASGLNGTVKFKAGKGRFHKLKVMQGILTLFNPDALTSRVGLGFDYLGGDVKIVKGLMSTKNLAMDGDQLKVRVTGTADLATQKLNLQGEAQPMQLLDAAIKNIPILGDILSGGNSGVIKTRFTVRGTFDDPQVSTNIAESLFNGLTGN